ncbi:hypothetical protein BKA70DRAFT_1245628 [Coprinopsis sp. MPI-PUGE-AT-0042]|nr:hypothetical protein BKA70DRAFT_1245628 [Coprinopsis sp. MPI-PUGE-AT-0042]
MSGINPYAQGGWDNSQNPWLSSAPSIYGALPNAPAKSAPKFVEFQCTALKPDILNCVIFGPNARHCYSITTGPASSTKPSTTVIQNTQGASIARVEWHQHPSVEAANILQKQYVSQFLPMAQDMSHRTMLVKGRPFAWTTKGASIQLYNTAYNPAELVAHITRTPTAIVLNVTQEAIHQGLLEICVIVSVLLYSGRRLD